MALDGAQFRPKFARDPSSSSRALVVRIRVKVIPFLRGAYLIKGKTDRNEFHIPMRSRNFWSRWAAPGRKLPRFYPRISRKSEGRRARINVSVQVNARAQSPPPPPPPLPSRSPDSTHQPSGFTVNVVVYTGWRDRYPAKAAERLSDELACVSTAETSPSLLPPPLFPPSLTAPMLFLANLRLRRFPSSDRKERSSISNAIKIWKNNSSRSIFLSNRSINREIVGWAFSKKKSEIFLPLYSSLFYFPLQSVP